MANRQGYFCIRHVLKDVRALLHELIRTEGGHAIDRTTEELKQLRHDVINIEEIAREQNFGSIVLRHETRRVNTLRRKNA